MKQCSSVSSKGVRYTMWLIGNMTGGSKSRTSRGSASMVLVFQHSQRGGERDVLRLTMQKILMICRQKLGMNPSIRVPTKRFLNSLLTVSSHKKTIQWEIEAYLVLAPRITRINLLPILLETIHTKLNRQCLKLKNRHTKPRITSSKSQRWIPSWSTGMGVLEPQIVKGDLSTHQTSLRSQIVTRTWESKEFCLSSQS
jgi:hypothetical protein